MNCRHRVENGDQCSRRRASGSRYCWQHQEDERWDSINLDGPILRRPPESPMRPMVTPDFIARLLAATTVDVTVKRVFAQEFCEAFAAVDTGFRADGFMYTALSVPTIDRP